MSLREQILRNALPPAARYVDVLSRDIVSEFVIRYIRNRRNPQSQRDFSTLDWSEFFDEKRLISSGTDAFNVYLKGALNSICLMCV